MAASLGLKLYNLGQRRDRGQDAQRPPRPKGGLVWLHAPSETQVSPMLALARRLIVEDGVGVLMTCPLELPARPGVVHQPPPGDSPAEVRAFLDHWKPDVVVFSDGELRPAALHESANRKLPVLMVNGRAPGFLRERDGWYPGLMRSALSLFSHICTVDEASARQFRKSGASLSAVAVTGRMEEESVALPCLEAERAALALMLAARPVWFAAGVPDTEEDAVLQAHRTAMQHSHRLLMILMPESPARADALARRLEDQEGWIVSRRSQEEEPAPAVEVFVVDNPAEYGLWYRLAPVTFIGGSVAGDGPIRSPMEAAALGSAILHGPRTGRFGPVFGRLGAARATRAVASASDLGEALGDLLAPDRAARLAQSAWMVASDGAEVTEQMLVRIRDLMDAAP